MKKILILAAWLLSYHSQGQNDISAVNHFNLKDGIAMQGYDPVTYFNGSKPLKGTKSNTVKYNHVIYQFDSKENQATFLLNPERYLPEYGGWCAYAMGAKAEKVDIDPGTYKIVHGKLYLFYNKAFNNTLKSWNRDQLQLMSAADKNWKIICTTDTILRTK